MGRTYWFAPHLNEEGDSAAPANADVDTEERTQVANSFGVGANLVSSLCDNGMHKPAIDLDVRCQLFESREFGKYHLYIDHEMSWEVYEALLVAFEAAGILERGYLQVSQKREQTFLRLPRVKA